MSRSSKRVSYAGMQGSSGKGFQHKRSAQRMSAPIKIERCESPSSGSVNMGQSAHIGGVEQASAPSNNIAVARGGNGKVTSLEPSTVVSEKSSGIHDIEKILAIESRAFRPLYLLKWKEHDYSDSTWENGSMMTDCKELLENFEDRKRIQESIISMLDVERHDYYSLLENVWLARSFYECKGWEDKWNALARAAGHAPIFVENWVDESGADFIPRNFKMIQANIFSLDSKLYIERMRKQSSESSLQVECRCQSGECRSSSVGCCARVNGMNQERSEADEWFGEENEKNWLTECCSDCSCDRNCSNRVVQRGRQIPVVIFRTPDRGWSVRTVLGVQANTFVMEYVGKVDLRKGRDETPNSYIFNVSGCGDRASTFLIDASSCGNEARFLNHSCDPNLLAFAVDVGRHGPYHSVAFFAKRDIARGDELTIDYYTGMDFKSYRNKAKRRKKDLCLCGDANCLGFLI